MPKALYLTATQAQALMPNLRSLGMR